jgi:hypothetical protein
MAITIRKLEEHIRKLEEALEEAREQLSQLKSKPKAKAKAKTKAETPNVLKSVSQAEKLYPKIFSGSLYSQYGEELLNFNGEYDLYSFVAQLIDMEYIDAIFKNKYDIEFGERPQLTKSVLKDLISGLLNGSSTETAKAMEIVNTDFKRRYY